MQRSLGRSVRLLEPPRAGDADGGFPAPWGLTTARNFISSLVCFRFLIFEADFAVKRAGRALQEVPGLEPGLGPSERCRPLG